MCDCIKQLTNKTTSQIDCPPTRKVWIEQGSAVANPERRKQNNNISYS